MYFITFVVSIPLVIALLLHNPEMQTVATRFAAEYLSRRIGTEVSIEKVNITFRGGLLFEKLLVKDSKGANLIAIDKFETRLGRINRKERLITLGKIKVDGLDFGLHKYKLDEMLNLDRFLEHFASGVGDSTLVADTTKPWDIVFKSLQINNSHFVYEDQDYKSEGPGMDFSDIEISGLNAEIENLKISGDTFTGNIINLSLFEKSGFDLKEFCGVFKVSSNEIVVQNLVANTNNSSLDLDLEFKFDSFDDFNDFVNNVSFDATFRPTALQMSDIGYFAPIMFTMTDLINLEGKFKGTVANIKGTEFTASFGNKTKFTGTVRMSGLPDITETFIHANVDRFTTSVSDLKQFALPGDTTFYLTAPDILSKLGTVTVTGKFTGFYNDFVSKAKFESNLGKLNTDITLKRTNDKRELSYSGKLVGTNLNVGKLFNLTSLLGTASFSVNVNGAGVKLSNLNMDMKGNVNQIEINGYNYKNVVIDGAIARQVFNGNLSVSDENLDFTFSGLADFNKETPFFNFDSKIKNANLFRLNLSGRDSTMTLSTNLRFDFTGNNIDNLDGKLQIDSTLYVGNSKIYQLENFNLESSRDISGKNHLSLRSGFIDADFDGNFKFSTLLASVKRFVGNYSKVVASTFPPDDQTGAEQVIDFAVNFKNTSQLTDLFAPKLKVAANSYIKGNFDTRLSTLNVNGLADSINFMGLDFYDCKISAASEEKDFNFSLISHRIMFAHPTEEDTLGIGIDSLRLATNLRTDTIFYQLTWNDLSNQSLNIADFEGHVQLESISKIKSSLNRVNLLVDGRQWHVTDKNLLVADTSGIFFNDFVFYSDSATFAVGGGISKNSGDSLLLNFSSLNISHLDLLIPGNDVDINGVLNGNAAFVNLYSNPNFLIDARLNNFYFNGEDLGTLRLKTKWDDFTASLGVNLGIIKEGNIGSSEVLTVHGDYWPWDDNRNFDFDVKLNNLSTDVFNPFVTDYVEISRESLASGALKLSGTSKKPVAKGKINLMRTQVLIKYLNVYYSAGGSVDVEENYLRVDNLNVYDIKGHPARCSGTIYHNYFKDFGFDIRIIHENFNALNTTSKDNDLFYGTAYATGIVDIIGTIDDVSIEMKASTNKGTRIVIPISSTVSVNENDFIIFINNADTVASEAPVYKVNLKGLTINLDLNVTSDADILIFLPYNMGDISGNGSGDLRLGVTPKGDFTINGDYVINKGKFNFKLEKLIKRDFEIMEGSKIAWSGDPYDAIVNIKGYHEVKTTLNGLQLQTDSTSAYGSKVAVKCIVQLQNELFNPDIRFSIDFANLSDDAKQIIYASLDTTDHSVMSQQMLSLLVMGTFSYSNNSPNISSAGFKLLSNQVNNWLSKISKDVDIGINYQPASKLTDDEIGVALKTQLFDEKLSIDGNFGVKGATNTQNTSSVVGDINVEYKITSDGRFRVRAFNRTNEISFLEDNAPYTQGVGVFFRKEFEKFKDLFKSGKSKNKAEKKSRNREKDAVLKETAKREEDE